MDLGVCFCKASGLGSVPLQIDTFCPEGRGSGCLGLLVHWGPSRSGEPTKSTTHVQASLQTSEIWVCSLPHTGIRPSVSSFVSRVARKKDGQAGSYARPSPGGIKYTLESKTNHSLLRCF
ncbi:hypothetical protein K491DRAFT_285262 [Lophiostoma macrostomum CBS 122681]|uniref:Uncharacterized protein n=1 Tax=Lophiostoma macrostomum CBS 122681 TaxID=1314788 RepID=A0A6A6TR55_9PLEO|nr:hypothetical protein K491DRAFT_285262 [Lophiostoma macrostomum CBS 122681]